MIHSNLAIRSIISNNQDQLQFHFSSPWLPIVHSLINLSATCSTLMTRIALSMDFKMTIKDTIIGANHVLFCSNWFLSPSRVFYYILPNDTYVPRA